ncbi:sulfatase [Verrucomicrobiaceae bacterium N1E253]|uniref:Sulfatase n=1 Tax=Oceaniferula marina TaxID=2748318 RepID=A0A851GH17_9BACT|nr:sulfatase [Oceaniferula marina]NWK54545.1 sulfatase [Oceaniferula marina]
MKQILWVGVLSLMVGTSCFAAEKRPPNVVLFFVDDLGWGDLGCNGNTFHLTPNIDAFAKTSRVFSDAYAYPSCSPSRACLVTGQNTPRHGIYNVKYYLGTRDWLKKIKDVKTNHFYKGDAPTIGTLMKRLGYKCGYAGKWHMGDEGKGLPQAHGFTQMNAGGCGWGHPAGGFFSPYKNTQLPDGPKGEYLSDRLTEESIGFIKKYKNEPFFLVYAPYLVHRPVEPKPEYVKLFAERPPSKTHRNQGYAAMVYAMDLAFGKLVESLKEQGVYENTLIVFTSDNGTNPACAKSLPLRGCKASIYEGGIRVPTMVYWKGVTSPGISKTPVSLLDWIPTFLDAGGGRLDGLTLDGESLLPIFDGKGKLKRDALFWHIASYQGNPSNAKNDTWTRPCSIIRTDQYKFVQEYENGTFELYDLRKDRSEKKNLAGDLPEVVSRLKKKLDTWLKDMDAVIPNEPNPNYDPSRGERVKKKKKK